eukprot:5815232-Prymnesium_polylepis.1
MGREAFPTRPMGASGGYGGGEEAGTEEQGREDRPAPGRGCRAGLRAEIAVLSPQVAKRQSDDWAERQEMLWNEK